MKKIQLRGFREIYEIMHEGENQKYSVVVNGTVKMFDLTLERATRYAKFYKGGKVVEDN